MIDPWTYRTAACLGYDTDRPETWDMYTINSCLWTLGYEGEKAWRRKVMETGRALYTYP